MTEAYKIKVTKDAVDEGGSKEFESLTLNFVPAIAPKTHNYIKSNVKNGCFITWCNGDG